MTHLKPGSLSDQFKSRIFFGFNYRFSALKSSLKQTINNPNYGTLINLSFQSTHGLAFKEEKKNDWRFTDSNRLSSITGNLGIHFVDLIIDLLGPIKMLEFHEQAIANVDSIDTVNIVFKCESNVFGTIFLSYAAPCQHYVTLNFSNAIVNIDCLTGEAELYAPRDYFDSTGMFSRPNCHAYSLNWSDKDFGLRNSLAFFFDTVCNSASFEQNLFASSLKSNMFFV